MSNTISKTYDAASPHTMAGALNHLIEHIHQNIESCIPGKFVRYESVFTNGQSDNGSYNRSRHVAIVTPLVKFPYVSGNRTVWTDRPELSLRVLRIKSGGFWFEMPLKEGDTGWIIAADRDTSFAISRNANVDESKNTKENGGGPQEYSNFNKLKYAFGFFLPDGFCDLKVKEGHEDSSIWANLKDDGSGESKSWIELCKDGRIVIHAEGETEDGRLMEWKKVLVEGFLEVNKDVDIGGTVVAEKMNEDGTENEDPVEIKDTEYLVPIDRDENLFAIWKGRSFRNKGEMGEPFKIGSGADGKLIKDVLYWPDEGGQGTWIKFIYTDDTYDQILAPRGPRGPQGPEGDPAPPGPGGGGPTYTAGSGISIVNNVISAHWV